MNQTWTAAAVGLLTIRREATEDLMADASANLVLQPLRMVALLRLPVAVGWVRLPGHADAHFPLARLGGFRAELHACFTRRADALFELGDALLCAPG
jgi:hypothetical protein